ncbi:hypothetical protein [Fodinicola feengrottensis]|uniref:Uncharacterized protein n=1 Tax=Fodinicola feengrottensis TaxID=435914 RepID=A0ABN2J2J7_9ACTN|nr:hypothetical protein [Fodinicola feengrottensis]
MADVEDDEFIVGRYAGRLGKVKLGRNSVAFARFADLDSNGMAELVAYVDQGIANGSLEPRYGRAGST